MLKEILLETFILATPPTKETIWTVDMSLLINKEESKETSLLPKPTTLPITPIFPLTNKLLGINLKPLPGTNPRILMSINLKIIVLLLMLMAGINLNPIPAPLGTNLKMLALLGTNLKMPALLSPKLINKVVGFPPPITMIQIVPAP